MNDQIKEKASTLERHVHSIINVVILAALGWTASTLLDLRDRSIKMEVSMQVMKEQFLATSQDRWTGADHRRYEQELERRFTDIIRRLEICEAKKK